MSAANVILCSPCNEENHTHTHPHTHTHSPTHTHTHTHTHPHTHRESNEHKLGEIIKPHVNRDYEG